MEIDFNSIHVHFNFVIQTRKSIEKKIKPIEMTSGAVTSEDADVVIEMNNIERSPDAVDGRRQQNIASFYHSKKSTAEGMMDISLLTANANQLKFILFYNQESKTFYAALSLIILSLVLQVSVGFLLIFRVSFQCFSTFFG